MHSLAKKTELQTGSVSAFSLWMRMMNTESFDRIIKTMIREGSAKSPARARNLCEAFCQWISLSTSSGDKPYLMFKGPVDQAFHAFVLNTEFYSEFCHKYMGKFINHNPLDSEDSERLVSKGGVEHTISLLVQTYGDKLHPELKRWVRQQKAGKLTASSVSCVRCE